VVHLSVLVLVLVLVLIGVGVEEEASISIGNRVASYLGSKREGYIICCCCGKNSDSEEEVRAGETSGSALLVGDALWSISMSMRKDGVGRSLTRVNADATGNMAAG